MFFFFIMIQFSCNKSLDDDGDGFDELSNDCDDNNPDIHPDAIEQCDGIDNNCDPTDGCGSVNGEEYTPVSGEEPPEEVYNYGSGSPWTSNTGFEQSDKTVIVVYTEPDGTTSILMTHDIINDGTGGNIQMTVTGAVGGQVLFYDDPGGGFADNFTFDSATGEGFFQWGFTLSDGMILGGFEGRRVPPQQSFSLRAISQTPGARKYVHTCR